MPAAHSASPWLCGRAPMSSLTRLQRGRGWHRHALLEKGREACAAGMPVPRLDSSRMPPPSCSGDCLAAREVAVSLAAGRACFRHSAPPVQVLRDHCRESAGGAMPWPGPSPSVWLRLLVVLKGQWGDEVAGAGNAVVLAVCRQVLIQLCPAGMGGRKAPGRACRNGRQGLQDAA